MVFKWIRLCKRNNGMRAETDGEGGCGGERQTVTGGVPTGAAAVTNYVALPPDGGWGWVIVTASFFCNIVVDGIVFSFGPLLKHVAQEFSISTSKATITGSLLSGFYLISGPFVSAIANRYGFRMTGILGSVIACSAFAAASVAPTIEILWLFYGVVGGIGFGMIYVPAVITTGFYFERLRALATGISVTGSGIGTIIIGPITLFLIEHFGWRGALLVQAGIILSCALFACLYRPLKRLEMAVASCGGGGGEVDATAEEGANLAAVAAAQTEETQAANSGGADCRRSSGGETRTGSESRPQQAVPLLQRIKLARENLLRRTVSYTSIQDEVGITANQPVETNRFLGAKNNIFYPRAIEALEVSGSVDRLGKTFEMMEIEKNLTNLDQKKKYDQNITITLPILEKNYNKRPMITPATFRQNEKKMSLPEEDYDPLREYVPDEALLAEHLHDDVFYIPKKRKSLSERRHSISLKFRRRTDSVTSTRSMKTRHHGETGVRPLYRDDIFFQASLHRLPQYKSFGSGLDYTLSVTRLPTTKDVEEEEEGPCSLCPEAVRRTLATMLDLSLLRSPSFMLFAVAGFITMLGIFTPFMYLADRGRLNGMDPGLLVFLVSSIGITNTLGRIFCGALTMLPQVDSLMLNNAALTIGGIATILSGISYTPAYQFFFAATFGLAISFWASLRSIVAVDLIGLEKLTNAFGILLLFQGLAATIGSPIAGLFMDLTGSYDTSFHLSGGLLLLSGVMCYPLMRIKKWEEARQLTEASSSSSDA